MRSIVELAPAVQKLYNEAVQGMEGLSNVDRDLIAADLQMRYKYGGQYVLWTDCCRKVDHSRRLVRKVLANSRDPRELTEALIAGRKRYGALLHFDFVNAIEEATK